MSRPLRCQSSRRHRAARRAWACRSLNSLRVLPVRRASFVPVAWAIIPPCLMWPALLRQARPPYGCCVSLEDAADNGAIGEHVEIVLVPLAGRARGRGALENQRGHAVPEIRVLNRPMEGLIFRFCTIRQPN